MSVVDLADQHGSEPGHTMNGERSLKSVVSAVRQRPWQACRAIGRAGVRVTANARQRRMARRNRSAWQICADGQRVRRGGDLERASCAVGQILHVCLSECPLKAPSESARDRHAMDFAGQVSTFLDLARPPARIT